jgi:hypothetical protein
MEQLTAVSFVVGSLGLVLCLVVVRVIRRERGQGIRGVTGTRFYLLGVGAIFTVLGFGYLFGACMAMIRGVGSP